MSQNYDYYNDGRLSFAHNTTDTKFDRSYFYDHAARLTEAKTSGQARGDAGDVPYHETFSYDAWSNTTNRLTQAWNGTQVFADSASYTNTRRNGWGYDADGRNTSIDARTHSYDAGGQQTLMTGPEWIVGHRVTISIGNGFDGDGQRVMQQGPFSITTYYLRSSALRGAVVDEINSSGQKQTGYVYAGRLLLANQSNGQVTWKHSTPAGTGLYDTHADGTYSRIELDPLGADVGLTSAPPDDTGGGDGDIGHNQIAPMLDSRLADVANPAGGCLIDNLPSSCDVARAMLAMGVAAPCPYADCGPRNVVDPVTGERFWEIFHALADGYWGYMRAGSIYDGQGQYRSPRDYPDSESEPLEQMPDFFGFGFGGMFFLGINPQKPAQQQDTRTDCQKFADIVEQIASETIGTRRDTPGLDVQIFMDRLATTFTEFTAARLGAVTGAPGEGVNRNHLTFGSSGFAQQFFEPGGNQVRHAAGGLIAGYVGIPLHVPGYQHTGIQGMNDREDPNDPIHGVPDINLNNNTVPYGMSIATYSKGPSLIGPGHIGGAQAIKRLPNWIRNTLCAH